MTGLEMVKPPPPPYDALELSSDDIVVRLRELWIAAVRATHYGEAATQQGARLLAEYRRELALERRRLVVPPGYDIDVLGDGKVKPVSQCATTLEATRG